MTDAALVRSARDGDRAAFGGLARCHLPLVYNLVRHALGDGPDVDDVVQDVMLRALRQLPGLREPESFRPWLTAIALNQIGTHLARPPRETTPLDELTDRPDPAADVEGPAALRADICAQRRQARQAARWLAADEQALLSLWWLETLGELSRTEVAAALGISVPHAAARLHRMRDHLDVSRAVVAALEAVPGCDELAAGWDAAPSPFWRKRLARHLRSCPVCGPAAAHLVPAERLLAGLVLLPVPISVTAAVTGKVKAGLLAGILHSVAAHPIAAATTAGTLALAVTVPTAGWSSSGSGSSPTPTLSGPLSLESADTPGRYVTVAGALGTLATPGDADARTNATFEAVPGLADATCVTFRVADGRYLRHSSFRLRLAPDEGTVLFRGDATFCPHDTTGGTTLESYNYPSFFIRHLGDDLWVDQSDGSATFRDSSTFAVRPPLA